MAWMRARGAFASTAIDPAAIGGDSDNAFMVLWPVEADYKANCLPTSVKPRKTAPFLEVG